MLGKLLKYDFKALFRYWWIAAISSIALSVLGGCCISVINTERQLPSVVYVTAAFGIIATIVGMSAFMLLTSIMVFVRYYRNFFTDEGYLTFTLPVKRVQLLNSKLISGAIVMSLSSIVLIFDFLLMLGIGFARQILTVDFFKGLDLLLEELWETFGGFYIIPYSLEFLALLILSSVFSILFLYVCITFASIIAKRAKVIVAIGIYYGANMIISFVFEIFYLFGISSMVNWFNVLPEESLKIIIVVILLGLIFLFAIACMILYTLVYHMLDRKLNLS